MRCTHLPARAWCWTAPWPGPCSWPSSRPGTPAGPPWSAARSRPAPDRRRPQTAWGRRHKDFSGAVKYSPEGSSLIYSEDSDKPVPENLFELFDLVVGIFLGTAVVQEGSGVGKRTGVYLEDSIYKSHDKYNDVPSVVMQGRGVCTWTLMLPCSLSCSRIMSTSEAEHSRRSSATLTLISSMATSMGLRSVWCWYMTAMRFFT